MNRCHVGGTFYYFYSFFIIISLLIHLFEFSNIVNLVFLFVLCFFSVVFRFLILILCLFFTLSLSIDICKSMQRVGVFEDYSKNEQIAVLKNKKNEMKWCTHYAALLLKISKRIQMVSMAFIISKRRREERKE